MTFWGKMAAYRHTITGVTIEIYDVDHGPPHCHISGLPGGIKARVNILTLEVTKPPGCALPRAVTKALRSNQIKMIEAWDKVISIDRGE